MAVINVTNGSSCILAIGNTLTTGSIGGTNSLDVPFVQDVTVNASTGVTRYKTLDSASEKAFTTPSTNQITLNVLVDEETFFGDAANADNAVARDGLFGVSNTKTKVYFEVGFEGSTAGDRTISGEGFISGLAPTVSMDQAVWITPVTIEVDGNLTAGTV